MNERGFCFIHCDTGEFLQSSIKCINEEYRLILYTSLWCFKILHLVKDVARLICLYISRPIVMNPVTEYILNQQDAIFKLYINLKSLHSIKILKEALKYESTVHLDTQEDCMFLGDKKILSVNFNFFPSDNPDDDWPATIFAVMTLPKSMIISTMNRPYNNNEGMGYHVLEF